MSGSSPRLVVRTYAPLQRYLIIGGSLLLVALGLYSAFEWGRRNAGFDGRSARAEASQYRGRIRDLEGEVRRLRLELASQETERAGQTRERAELARNIGELQAEVARQAQDLAFYRGIVGEDQQGEVVKVQQFRVTKAEAPNEYRLRLVLGRPLRPEDTISGTVKLTFEGTTAGNAVNLDLSSVSDVADGQLRFNFRYVETLEQAIRLPAGFAPARTTLELLPLRKGAEPVRQTFIWTVETA